MQKKWCVRQLPVPRTVGAALRIQARIGDDQALDRLVSEDVGLDDFVDIAGMHAAVPHGVRIDDDGGPVLALLQASGLVGANYIAANTVRGEHLLKLLL